MSLFPPGDNNPIDIYPVKNPLDGTELIEIQNQGTGKLYARLPDISNFIGGTVYVVSATLSTPPVSPADQDSYIVASSPTGSWAGHANQIATWSAALPPQWVFSTPVKGWRCYLASIGIELIWNGTSWVAVSVTQGAGMALTAGSASAAPIIALDANMAALDALTSTGITVRTTTNSWAQRTITATANAGLSVTNGNGVSGNPALAFGNYLPSETGGVARSVIGKFSDVLSVKDFGAIGDGTSHALSTVYGTLAAAQAVYPFASSLSDEIDWAAFQALAYRLSTYGGFGVIPDNGTYLINRAIDFIPQKNTSAVLSGQSFPFSDVQPFVLVATAGAHIKATAAMDTMFNIHWNTGTYTATAPWYYKIDGIFFDGNANASKAIRLDYAFGGVITNNRIVNAYYGIYGTGYGGMNISDNEISCTWCVYSTDRFGDSIISNNDFYPINGGAGIRFTYFGGDTVIRDNVFTGSGVALDSIMGIQIDGNATLANSVGNVTINNNEFAGMTCGVIIYGSATPVPQNVYSITVRNNHTAAHVNANTGSIIRADNVQGLVVQGNFGCNESAGVATTVATSYFAQLNSCTHCIISGNIISNYTSSGVIQMYSSTSVDIKDNCFYDYGQGNAANCAITVGTGCLYCLIIGNRFSQSNVLYGQVGVNENAGANYTTAENNYFFGVATPFIQNGANSILSYSDYGAAAPVAGTFLVGARRYNSAPAPTAYIGWVCTTAGTPGTWKGYGAIQA